MRKIIKIILCISLNLSLSVLTTAYAAEKIKIGLLIPMTGPNKDLGQSIIKATRLAVKDIDSNLIEIIPKDTATKPNQTLKSAFELKEMGVRVVIGPIFFESTQALLLAYQVVSHPTHLLLGSFGLTLPYFLIIPVLVAECFFALGQRKT